jgi:ABC-2 type transport system permease protein
MYPILWREFKQSYANVLRMVTHFTTPIFLLLFFAVVFSANIRGISFRGAQVSYIQFFVPGLVAYLTFLLFAMTFSLVRMDRVSRITAVILVSPTSFVSYFAARLIANVCTTFLKVIVVGLLAFFVSRSLVPFTWSNMFLFFSGLTLGAIFWSSLGFIASAFITREDMRDIIFMLLTMPLTFASSMYYNLDYAPTWIRLISSVNPLTYTSNIIRQSFLVANPIGWTHDFLCLIVSALIVSSLAIFSLRRLTL